MGFARTHPEPGLGPPLESNERRPDALARERIRISVQHNALVQFVLEQRSAARSFPSVAVTRRDNLAGSGSEADNETTGSSTS
jgi:hypothetical protein